MLVTPCFRCKGRGYVPLPPKGAMTCVGPCDCEVGQQWSRRVTEWVERNPPDKEAQP